MTQDPSFIRRYWILLVFRAVCLAGSGTIASDFFHRLVYYVNALLPSIGLPSETARVLKASYGPFFPEYQWELDRLVGTALVEAIDIKWVSEDQRFFGKYKITRCGMKLAEELSNGTANLLDIERGISEMVSAFLSNPGALSTLAARFDANFGQNTIREGEVIDFGEWRDQNHSRDAAVFLFGTWLEQILSSVQTPESEMDDEQTSHTSNLTGRTTLEAKQYTRSFHLYAHYLAHRLAQESQLYEAVQ